MNLPSKLFLLWMLGCLIGCASMSKEECLNANWKNIGYEDGSMGRPEMTVQAHRKACAKINITPDLAQYQQGHREGARAYCKKPTAYQLGVNGGAYYNVCPADLEPGFLQAYRLGQELFAIAQQIDQVEADIAGYHSSIDSLEQQKAEQKAFIVNADSSSKERRVYLNEIDRLEDEIRHFEHDIGDAEHELDHLARDYAKLEAEHRRMGY
jgi:Protein of unknown function (DUF2799)